jgi:hypothetical protein
MTIFQQPTTTVTLHGRTSGNKIALMQNLRASLRIHRIALAVLLCLTLTFVAITSRQESLARFFFGFFSLATAGVLLVVYRKETAIADSHLVASGTVNAVKAGHRGGNIEYCFVAFNGVQYSGESDWDGEPIRVGTNFQVLYKTLDPAINQPLKQFLFYSFDAYGS